MAKLQVLLEVTSPGQVAPFSVMKASDSLAGAADLFSFAESLLSDMTGLGVEVTDAFGPVPLAQADPALPADFGGPAAAAVTGPRRTGRGKKKAIRDDDELPALPATGAASMVVPCEVSAAALATLMARDDVVVWPNSPMTLFGRAGRGGSGEQAYDGTAGQDADEDHLFGLLDLATSAGGTDCRPFRRGVSMSVIRNLLGVERLWRDGFRGQNIIVAILDEGVNRHYPVVGGHETQTERRWGLADIESHGSMCAADILVAAPSARLYDYPFLGHPTSGGALAMFHAVLERHRLDGTPHLTNNSYGFTGVPPQDQAPNHEIWNLNHPIHRKVREVVAEGISCFFAAGNCGESCPSGKCHSTSIGPGRSIHASNSLVEVITVTAVNSQHERVGYSSQGPGMFDTAKPDIAAYTHFFGNFGPRRPGGLAQDFDNGTSAATPVACGVAAALLSAFADLSPAELKDVLMASGTDLGQPGRDHLTGAGAVNAAMAYQILRASGRAPAAARPQLMARV
jgi:serine protease AprX